MVPVMVASPRLSPKRVVLALTALSLAALAIGHIAIALGRDHETTSDWASIEMSTRDVFSRHPPLIGAWSRYEWSHPGPLLFYVLAIPYRLGGQTWQALWVGTILVNVTAIAVAVWLTARRSAVLAGAVLLAGLTAVAWFRPHLMSDDWNATIVVLPVLTVLAAAAAVTAGDRAGLPVLVCTYMFVAQCHFGYGVVLLPAAAWGAFDAYRRWRRPTLRWLEIGVALWLPVMVDTVVHWPGNFLNSIGWNLTADEHANGFGEAGRVVGRATSLSWLQNPGIPRFDVVIARPPIGTLPFLALVALAGAWWASRRFRFRHEQQVAELVALTWFTGFVAVARIKGPIFRWLVEWAEPLTALTWAVVIVVAARTAQVFFLAPPRERIGNESSARGGQGKLPLAGFALTAAAAATFITTNLVGAVGEPYTNAQWAPIVRQFAVAVEADPRVGTEPTLIDLAGDARLSGAVQAGLINLLEKDGLEPRSREDQKLQFGRHRAGAARPERLLVRGESSGTLLAGVEVMSVWDPLSPTERVEADALTTSLATLLTANGLAAAVPLLDTPLADLADDRAPPAVTAREDEFDRLATLRRRGERVVLYWLPGP